ncbi:J domain-containing protein [Xanthomonas floridensis]|uniref:J domain-containing protein n=1 Tax=Xanthomonas floridensis TaxID=1843580 RepID=A0ABU5Q1P5_9XANT|nr:J domain-containing protein [Xanthomonas floridensis]MEA5125804.1 J domain-containing protein [Xanthomonas floridensis]MEA5133453.1 J domain-containing protein [Xanthomonas floridensis]
MSWAVEALGLTHDADARAIKRAYAVRLKTTRPDDDPAAFQQLHETYQAALAWAAAITRSHAEASAEEVDAGRPVGVNAGVASLTEEVRTRRQPWAEAIEGTAEDIDAHMPEAAHAGAAPPAEEARSRRQPRAEVIQDPILKAELARWQDNAYVQDGVTRILAAADSLSAADFSAWLRALPETWSLELRPRIGYAIASRIAHDGVALSDATFDAFIACFSDDEDSDLGHALWAGRVMAIVLGQSPDFLAHWMEHRVTVLPDEERGAIGTLVLRALRERQATLQLKAIDALSRALCWSQLDHNRHDRAWLHDARKVAQVQGRSRRRLAALSPGGDAAVLAQELEASHWRHMTPQWAAALRARVVGPPSWRACLLSALLPMRPAWMYRFCGIINHWFPDGLPTALQPQHVRFWKQLGNRRRPHGWQLAVGIGRGLAVAVLLAVGATLMLPIAGIAASAWVFPTLGAGLMIWSALVMVQMAARWQACTAFSSEGKRVAHRWAIPVTSAVILAVMRSGASGAASSAALAYIAIFRLTGRMDPDSRSAVMPMLTFVGLGTPILMVTQAGAWFGTVFALLLWVVSLIQDAQHRRLQGGQ